MLGSFPLNQLDVVLSFCPDMNHGLDGLQRELSRQVAMV